MFPLEKEKPTWGLGKKLALTERTLDKLIIPRTS